MHLTALPADQQEAPAALGAVVVEARGWHRGTRQGRPVRLEAGHRFYLGGQWTNPTSYPQVVHDGLHL